MRLDKLLSNMGFGSRKEVRVFIRKGKVTVNDKVIRNNKLHIDVESDEVLLKGDPVVYQKYVYLMMHKPPGYISATEDYYEKTVIDLLPPEWQHFNPFPVGRLDKDTEGLLLITNDGGLAHELTSPKKEVPKTYYAKIQGKVTDKDVSAFQLGVTLDDGYVTKPGELKILKSDFESEIELTITEGKFHQVKRMFEAREKKVTYLKRLRMGELFLDKNLSLGSVRELTEDELNDCFSSVKE